MNEFIWIDWNLQKIDNHGLSSDEVEFAMRGATLAEKNRVDGEMTFESVGRCPSGRRIKIVWKYNLDRDGETKIFVITAYGR